MESVRNKRGGGEDEAKSSLALHFPLGFGGNGGVQKSIACVQASRLSCHRS